MIYTIDNGKCKLCLENDLEEVGSHIFPDFLIRGAIYQDEKTKRGDYETIFEIGETEANAKFFGSSVLPEMREKLLGHEQTEEEIQVTNKNPFIDTGLVCRQCERSFGPVEASFKSLIYDRMVDEKAKLVNQGTLAYHLFEEDEYYLALLLVLINAWRASASINFQWKMGADTEEQVRVFLNNVLHGEITDILKLARENISQVKSVRFSLHFTEQTCGKPSQNAVFIDIAASPSMFVTNQLIALFSEDNFDSVQPPKVVSDVITRGKVLNLIDEAPNALKVHHINNDERLRLLQSYHQRQAQKVWQYIVGLYKEAHFKLWGESPSLEKLKSDMQEFLSIIEEHGMFTSTNIIKALAKVLKASS